MKNQSKHIHEVYGYLGVFSCIGCPKQFTLKQVNKYKNIKITELKR